MLRAENFTFPETEQKQLIKDLTSKALGLVREHETDPKQKQLLEDTIIEIAANYEKGDLIYELASTPLEKIIEQYL